MARIRVFKVIEFKHNEDQKLLHGISELTHAIRGLTCTLENRPKRFIRLQVVEVRFVQPENQNKSKSMDNLGIDIPQGLIARIVFAPKDQNGASAKLDGPVTATVQGDPSTAQVAVDSASGLIVDIKLPGVVEETATIEVDGDANLDPSKADVITTLITARTVAVAVPEAVTLGATPASVTTLPADQFGVFPATTSARKK
jgi:hypothetical protein